MRYKLKPPVDLTEWRTWFAWYPVRIVREIVWLETVERKWFGLYSGDPCSKWVHRLPIE